jgi:hypothetical protein
MQAAREAMSAAQACVQQDAAPPLELPAFGTGIEFRPQARRERSAAAVSAAAERANAGKVGLQLGEEDSADQLVGHRFEIDKSTHLSSPCHS